MSSAVYWCERALVDGIIDEGVVVTIENGRFGSVHGGVSAPPDGSIRLRGVTIPGLANAHSHAFHRALRSRTQSGGGTFWTWRQLMFSAAQRLDPDLYHRLARATLAEMALAGITVVGEFHYLHHQPDGTPYAEANAMGSALLAAASEAGVRMTLLDTLYLYGGLDTTGYRPVEGVQARYADQTADTWANRVNELEAGPGQQIGAAIHSVRAVDPGSMRAVVDWADQRSAPIHAHVSEQPAENEQCVGYHRTTPTGVLDEVGALGPHFSAVHATHLSDGDVQAMAASGGGVCVCPTTERDLGDGIGPTAQLAAAGVDMSLGSDSHAVIDLLEEARGLELDERLRSGERGVHSPTELLSMATVHGHAALGWADAGRIAPGCRADLVTIRLDSVRTAGTTTDTAAEAVVFAASAADVSNVIVDGRSIVVDGKHVSIDVATELHASIVDLMDE
ncbi:MAG: formimidoylglutamate deiminase [Actinomycetia bacterium]|nr:formimidoylglutamate deiminase [Actinomycetes bacterium]